MSLGIKFPDLVVISVIQDALDQIYDDPTILEQLFSDFKESHFSTVFGDKEINSINEYMLRKTIRTIAAWNLIEAHLPCFSVTMQPSQELDNEALLDDFGSERFLDSEGEAVQKNPSCLVYPEVIPSHETKDDVYSVPVQESILIGVHAPDNPYLCRYMAWLLHYILRSKKNTFIDRGLNRISISFSDFQKVPNIVPDHVYTRFCTLSCVHYLTFNEADLLLDDDTGIDLTVKGSLEDTELSPGSTNKRLPSDATFISITRESETS